MSIEARLGELKQDIAISIPIDRPRKDSTEGVPQATGGRDAHAARVRSVKLHFRTAQ